MMDPTEGAVALLRYLKSLPTRDGWVRPDPARAPLTACKMLAGLDAVELRGFLIGAHEVRITAAGLRMLVSARGAT